MLIYIVHQVRSVYTTDINMILYTANPMQATKHASKGTPNGFEIHGKLHQKPKTGVQVAPLKDLVTFKIF